MKAGSYVPFVCGHNGKAGCAALIAMGFLLYIAAIENDWISVSMVGAAH